MHSGPDKLCVAGRRSLHGSGCGLVTTQIQPVASSRLARRTFARHDPASPAKRFLPQRACCNKICCPRPRTPKLVICARGIGSACGGLGCNMCAPGARQMFAVSVGGWAAGRLVGAINAAQPWTERSPPGGQAMAPARTNHGLGVAVRPWHRDLFLCCFAAMCLCVCLRLWLCIGVRVCVCLRVSVYVAVCLFVSLRVRTREGRTRVS